MKNHTKKSYTFRLNVSLINQLDQMGSNRTGLITDAIQMYVDPEIQNNYDSNTETLHILKDQLDFLKGQVTFLQKENSYLSQSWFARLLLPRPR